jgi:pilus assembly protein Flp/PilA
MFEIVNRVLTRALAWHNSRDRDRGASAVEYALILFAIAAAVAAIVGLLGTVVLGKFTDSCKAVHGGAAC